MIGGIEMNSEINAFINKYVKEITMRPFLLEQAFQKNLVTLIGKHC